MDKVFMDKSQMRKLKTNVTKLQNLTLRKKYCFDRGYDSYNEVCTEHKKVLNRILSMFEIED
ncbi:hypothetical protein NVP1161O_104 [Vibrio phage 1.161.O._10N.261.48.C5]|nr:hypothetical protein NVP1161O_104 [Vibrio phage 1.161.O._10N.261.48.C5]